MKKLIEHIRSKPESFRRTLASMIVSIIGIALIAVLILTVWINHATTTTTGERPTLTESLMETIRSY